MLKFGQYITFWRYGLELLTVRLLGALRALFHSFMAKIAFKQSRELLKRDMIRPGGKVSWFTPNESALVNALASLIVPSDDVSPGAQDAEAVNTLERNVANSSQRKELYSRGLYSFDKWAQWKYGLIFIKLTPDHQLALMKVIDQEYQKLYKKASLGSKLMRKFKVLPYLRMGLFDAVELFPTLKYDVLQTFYTSDISWVWLGYDGPPMSAGYPDLLERRSTAHQPDITVLVDQPRQQLDEERRILVCIKQVPGRSSQYTIDKSGYGLDEEKLSYETNESDLYALEEALRLKREFGGEVSLLSLGEKRVIKSLREGLARGADRAIYVNDAGFQNVNPFLTAKIIAAAISNEKYDLVLTGVESGDFAWGQTGIMLAHLLNWPCVTIVVDVEIGEGWKNALVKRELESNTSERIEVSLPAVLTVQTSTIKPGYTSLRGILQARTKEIRTLSSGELGFELYNSAHLGSRIDILKLYLPENKKNTVMLEGSADVVAKALIEKLKQDAKVL